MRKRYTFILSKYTREEGENAVNKLYLYLFILMIILYILLG